MKNSIDYTYTKTPNCVLDDYMSISSHAGFKTISFITRKTLGFNKQTERISQKEISNATGLHVKTVAKCIRELVKHGILIIVKECTRFISAEYQVNINWTPEVMEEKAPSEGRKSSRGGSLKLPNKEHIKNTLKEKMHYASFGNRSDEDPVTDLPVVNSEEEINEAVKLLTEFGIKGKNLIVLSKQYKLKSIKEQIEFMPFRDVKINPKGYLVKAIKKKYSPPKAYKNAQATKKEQEASQVKYVETLQKIKEMGHFFIAGMKAQVIEIEGQMVKYSLCRRTDSRGIRSLVECLGATV